MKRSGIFVKIVILVLVLFVPGFLYYLLVAQGKNRYKPLPVFGPKELAKTSRKIKGKLVPDTIYHKLRDFKLTSQYGMPVSLSTFNNKIFVVDFFYTSCPYICKLITANMAELDSAYKKNRMVDFVSITVDPKHDNEAVLKNYATKFKASPGKWFFLTGDTASIYSAARNGFLVNAIQTGKSDFIYSDKLILIDEDKRIRGYYSGAETSEVARLNDELKVLISEEIRKHDKALY